MNNKLGEVFYNGRIINLDSTDEQELKNIVNDLETSQVSKKEKIKNILEQLGEEG